MGGAVPCGGGCESRAMGAQGWEVMEMIKIISEQ